MKKIMVAASVFALTTLVHAEGDISGLADALYAQTQEQKVSQEQVASGNDAGGETEEQVNQFFATLYANMEYAIKLGKKNDQEIKALKSQQKASEQNRFFQIINSLAFLSFTIAASAGSIIYFRGNSN